MDYELESLQTRVIAMQNISSLTGRKKASVLSSGLEAEKVLEAYSKCKVYWIPEDIQSFTSGSGTYLENGNEVDGPNSETNQYLDTTTTEGAEILSSENKTTETYPTLQLTDDITQSHTQEELYFPLRQRGKIVSRPFPKIHKS